MNRRDMFVGSLSVFGICLTMPAVEPMPAVPPKPSHDQILETAPVTALATPQDVAVAQELRSHVRDLQQTTARIGQLLRDGSLVDVLQQDVAFAGAREAKFSSYKKRYLLHNSAVR